MGCLKLAYRTNDTALKVVHRKYTGNENNCTGAYRYGFNGQEKDDEIEGSGNSYDYGARNYDSRLGRFTAIDPKAAAYPWQSPYVFAANNPIQNIDENGEGANPPKPLTRDAFIKMANDAGIYRSTMSGLRFNKTIGYAFERAYINARTGFTPNYKTLNGVKPDALYNGAYAHSVKGDWASTFWPKVEVMPNANAYEIKATMGDIKLSKQIKGEIDLVASSKSKEGTDATSVGVANLTIVTFAGVQVSQKVIDYAKEKNVNLLHVTGELNDETGEITFSAPTILNAATTKAGVINGVYQTPFTMPLLTSEVPVPFEDAKRYSGVSNESGNDSDCSHDEPCSGP